MQRCCKRAHSKSENARRPYREAHPGVHEWCAWLTGDEWSAKQTPERRAVVRIFFGLEVPRLLLELKHP